VVALVSWLLAMAFSLVNALPYMVPVSLALACAVPHFAAVTILLRRGTSRFRFLWLILSLPLAIYTLDNLGRLSASLGGPLFRLVI
jgi:hypothetical protein